MLKSGSKGVDTTHLCVNTNFSIFSIPQLIRGTRAMIPINSSDCYSAVMWQAPTNICWWYCCQYLLHEIDVNIFIMSGYVLYKYKHVHNWMTRS
jgi:hypothetical protein